MKRPGFISLQWKLLALMFFVGLVFWIVLSILHLRDQQRLIERNLEEIIDLRKANVRERAHAFSKIMLRQVENDIAAYNLSALMDNLQASVVSEPDLSYAILMDAAGIVRIHTARPELVNAVATEEADTFAATRQSATVREYGRGPAAVLEHIEPIRFGNQPWGVLRLGYSLETLAEDIRNAEARMREERGRLVRQFVSVSTALLLAGGILMILVARRFIWPIEQLTRAADALSKGNFDAARTLPRGQNDELGLLSNAFASMSTNLERTQQKSKQLVEAARSAEMFLTSIVENIPHMIFVKDAETLRFVRLNRAGEGLLGRDRRELIGKSDYDLFDAPMASAFTRMDREALTRGELVDIPEEPVTNRDGQVRVLHTKKIPIRGTDGKPRYLLGISEDITEAIALLKERRRLEDEILNIATAEQERIAHDLHDGLGQILTALSYKAKFIERAIAEGEPLSAENVRRIVELAGKASEQARALARGLDPVVLRDGLPLALQDLVHSLREDFGVQTSFHSSHDRIPIEKRCAVHLYRIAQEAATNAIRHGHAHRIDIGLIANDRELLLTVTDDGIGFPDDVDVMSGAGLRNMRYRARSLNGELTISRRQTGGVLVVCSTPLHQTIPSGEHP